MKLLTNMWSILTAVLVGGMLAIPTPALAEKAPAKQAGVLHVYDQGKMFSQAGIDKAKSTMGNTQFDHGLTLTIDTYQEIPEDKKAGYKDENKTKFFKDWAVAAATGEKAKGIYVLICRSPGYIEVISDKTTRERGFTSKDEQHLRDLLLASFKDAKAAADEGKSEATQHEIRDTALLASINFVVDDLKDTTVATAATATKSTGMGIGGWICLGLCVMLGIWLVIGLIRAFTGGGGGGGPGGGGGGGFGSSLLGGLFGAMAGMWLYNSMFGGGGMFGGGSDAHAGDGSSDTGASGDGDFGGDTGAGGSFDGGGGDFGGGDF